jgi:hypothetical protein
MAARRGATRLAAVLTLVAGLVAIGAVPAAAADDSVGIRLPSRFTAGGSAGSVSVSVTKRTEGCVLVRTALAIRLEQLPADQVKVEVSRDGDWRSLRVSSAGDGLVVTEHTAPNQPVLCRKKSLSVRYRVTFLKGAPGGEATLVAEAYTGGGGLIDRAAGTRDVVNRSGVVPTSRTESPTPPPTTEPADLPGQQSPAAAAAGQPGQGDGGGLFGVGAVVMLLGVVMVGVGIALLVALLRRARADRDEPAAPAYPGGGPLPPSAGGDGDHPTLILPRVPY